MFEIFRLREKGYAFDICTIRSKFLGRDKYGLKRFKTTRSPMGECMDNEQKWIWKSVEFNAPLWDQVNTAKFDNLLPSWKRRRVELEKNPDDYKQFMDKLKRKQAIDTGILEKMYDLKKGVTETLIKEGFRASNIQYGDTNIPPELLMDYLNDNLEAIDYVFYFIKNDRELTVSYIKELHALITRHQDTIDAIDQFGRRGKVPLLKGEYKKSPNNPQRDGVIYNYCPPEHTASEMDNLIDIFNNKLNNAHIIIKAAYLHHSFVQIHPFQDGNGRLARLLASFVVIKGGLFPLTIERDERAKYINALEKADKGQFQELIDVFSNDQIKSIQQSLNLETTVDSSGSYKVVLNILEKKLSSLEKERLEENKRVNSIKENMKSVYDYLIEELEQYAEDLKKRFNSISVNVEGIDKEHYDFLYLIFPYAKFYKYYANHSLKSYSIRMTIEIADKKHWLLISLHYYGYDNSTFAIGAAMLPQELPEKYNSSLTTPIKIPPLTMSSEKELTALEKPIHNHLESIITMALACVANTI
jgi:prophage maintenance system killer protein